MIGDYYSTLGCIGGFTSDKHGIADIVADV